MKRKMPEWVFIDKKQADILAIIFEQRNCLSKITGLGAQSFRNFFGAYFGRFGIDFYPKTVHNGGTFMDGFFHLSRESGFPVDLLFIKILKVKFREMFDVFSGMFEVHTGNE